MAPGSKTIFVANIPYDVSEEQLQGVFSEVGPVSSVEIKFDTQTGRSKGYAFVHYFDEATAGSAVRNLHEVLVNGRNLRVESSTDEPDHRKRGGPGGGGARGGGRGGAAGGGGGDRGGPGGYGNGGPPGGAGGGYGGGSTPSYGRPPDDYPAGGPAAVPSVDISALPPGQDVPPGQKATDVISKTLAAISPGQMQDVMSGMKTLIATQPDKARQLLQSKPQLAYALFQAMLLMNIVDPSVLQRIQPLPPAPTAAPGYPPPNPAYPPYPPAQSAAPPPANYPPYPPQPQSGYRPPSDPRVGGYNAPPPPAQPYAAPPPASYAPPPQAPTPIPPQAQAALATLPEDQRAMLMQVLQMTPDQISALDASQQASIMQLRQQFLGTA